MSVATVEKLLFSAEDVRSIVELKIKIERITSEFKNSFREFVKSEIVSNLNVTATTLISTEANLENGIVVAGGCFASWYHGESANDIDIFLLESVDTTIIQNYFLHLNKDLDGNRITTHDADYFSKFSTKQEKITCTWKDSKTAIQVIATTFKTKKELLDHFDFVHCCMNYHNGQLHVSPRVLDAIKTKTLIQNCAEDNFSVLKSRREDKYKKRGYKY